jgi:hypothetical protein
MKKLILFVVSSLLLSCSTDQPIITPQEATMVIGFKAPKTSTTHKDVKRGVLPIELGNINVTTLVPGSTGVLHDFNIVPDVTLGAEDGFTLHNMQTGMTTFSVLGASSNSVQEYCTIEKQTNVADGYLALSNRIPYILYHGNTLNKEVYAGTNDPIQFTLTPEQGRIIMLFQMEQAMQDLNYTFKIIPGSLAYGQAMSFKGNEVGSFYASSVYTTESSASPLSNINYEVYNAAGVRVNAGNIKATVINGVSTDILYTFLISNIPVATNAQSTFKITPMNHGVLGTGGL